MNNNQIFNSNGKIYYGMHFYPGLAQYSEPNKDPFRIFLNEDTLRKMDASFAAKPIFVEHVDEVNDNIDQLRNEADGWVIESFFNSVDGKHWVKFIIVSKQAEDAIQNGYRLSNAYVPQLSGRAGEWNGISYQNEVIDGEYEHLAIVQNPRYAESVVMTPNEFKSYNENLQNELKRIANSKQKESKMTTKFKFWNRKPVENAIDIENLSVTLPKCGKEYSILNIINAMEDLEEKKKENMADPSAMVKMHDGTMCNVGDMINKYKNMADEYKKLKEVMSNEDEEESDLDIDDDSEDGEMQNEEDEDDKDMKKKEPMDKEEMEEKKKNKKMKNENVYFNNLKYAHLNNNNQDKTVYESMVTKDDRGFQKYGT